MGKRVSYEERGDHTWELLDAVDAAKRAGWTPGSGTVSAAAKKAFDRSWNASTKAREASKKGR